MLDLSATAPAQRWLVPLFFGLMLLLGLRLYPDYAVSIDENQSRDNGMITLKHVAEKVAPAWVAADPDFARYTVPLADYYDRDYGVAFETPVCLAERLLGLQDTGDKFRFRHLCTFLVCFTGLLAVYQLARRRFADWRLGLLAALWLLLSPRLFADFFYNDKDAVFMALFAVATNAGVGFIERPTAGRAAWYALLCALTIDVRIMGILLPAATAGMLGWRVLRGEVGLRPALATGALYLALLAGFVVLFWPYLWPAPLANFGAALQKMSTFRWGGVVLYNGNFVAATDLPWHYAPVWIAITTPLLYLAAGVLGLVLVLGQAARQRWRLWADAAGRQDVFFTLLFGGPLLAVIVLHSVLYDGWRQLYFVYPAFLLLALRGWVAVLRWQPARRWWRPAVLGLTGLSAAATAGQIVAAHPLQNVYFNLLAGAHVAQRFELDYWGLGYVQDLAYIVAHDDRPVVTVFAPPPSPAEFNTCLLPEYQRGHLRFVEKPDSADYFITNYRWHPEDYPYPNEVYQLRADGRRVHSVFRLR